MIFLFLHFWNSHQAICLWVEAILKPGSGGWWRGMFLRETNWAQSGVLKQIQTCVWEILSCLSVSQTPNSRQDMSPKPPSQNKSSYSAMSQSHYQGKPNLSAKALMRWQMRGLCVACRQLKPWWSCECWELLWNYSWKAFCGLESDSTATATASLWNLTVKLNNTQSSWVAWSKKNWLVEMLLRDSKLELKVGLWLKLISIIN